MYVCFMKVYLWHDVMKHILTYEFGYMCPISAFRTKISNYAIEFLIYSTLLVLHLSLSFKLLPLYVY